MWVKDGWLKNVDFYDIFLLNSRLSELELSELWKDVIRISPMVFAHSNLIKLKIPEGVEGIFYCACFDCQKLKYVEFPETFYHIGRRSFEKCTNLTTVVIKEGIKFIRERAFFGCSSLPEINLPNTLEKIESRAFESCSSLKKIIIPSSITALETSTFDGCKSLEYISIPNAVVFWGSNVFRECPINFVHINPNGSFILSKHPQNVAQSTKVIDISKCRSRILGFDLNGYLFLPKNTPKNLSDAGYEKLLKENRNAKSWANSKELLIDKYVKIADVAVANNIILNNKFVRKLIEADKVEDFCNSNFKYFNKIQQCFPEFWSLEKQSEILTFAYDIGCFSNKQKLSQQASEWMIKQLQSEKLDFVGFDDFPANGENEEFSNFLFSRHHNNNEPIFDQILKENNCSEFLKKIYLEFCNPESDIASGGRFRDEKGRLRFAVVSEKINKDGTTTKKRHNHVPTVEKFKEYFSDIVYGGIINDDDKKIAAEFKKWGLAQKEFDLAKQIMSEYHNNSVPANILGFHLHDLQTEIDDYRDKSQKLLEEGYSCAEEILGKVSKRAKEFSYDWLEKNDERNFCLGLYCSCCAHMGGVGYGIMHANFVHPDVQNIAITRRGVPVAKSTMFLNREKGYAVFNTISVSEELSDEEKDKVYEEFLLGINDFAQAYNRQNPNNPLRIMTVGMTNNELKKQIERTKQQCDVLNGLDFSVYGLNNKEYCGDWEKQYKLWELNQNGGCDDGRKI